MISPFLDAFFDWLRREPVLAVLGFSALAVLVTILVMLTVLRRHGQRRFAEGQASLLARIQRLEADLDEATRDLSETRKENQALTQQRLELTASMTHYKTESARIPALENQVRQWQEKAATLHSENASLQTRLQEQKRLNIEQKSLIDKAQENLTAQFENLAQNILDKKSQKFTQQNNQNIKATLSPLQQQINQFQEMIRKTHQEGVAKHSVLLQEIENLKQLNMNISEEARALTRALKSDSKAQGNWGELVLERVLESSGLQKGREYDTQKSIKDNGKRYHPDVIIHLPDGKDVIVDAKVSLTAYERYRNADNEADREHYLKEHIQSLRTHARQLGEKNYQDLESVHTVDMVIMFVPVEPAYLEAMNKQPDLLEEAFNRKVLMLSTSNLLATLRTIATIWQNEKRNQNALEIARQAGALYDKFVGFCQDLNEIKQRLDQADTAWHKAENKLTSGRGNLVKASERIRELGAKTKKQLDRQWLEKHEEIALPASGRTDQPPATEDENA